MNPRNSHTHCQVAQADTQAKTWQRVCLPRPKKIELKKFPFPSENKKYASAQTNTKKTVKRSIDNGLQGRKTRTTGYNTVLPKWRQKCYYEAFVQGSTVVILLSFSANNPPLRQYPKRYSQW